MSLRVARDTIRAQRRQTFHIDTHVRISFVMLEAHVFTEISLIHIKKENLKNIFTIYFFKNMNTKIQVKNPIAELDGDEMTRVSILHHAFR